MDKVKAMLAAGVSLSTAVQEALGARTLREVALEQGVNRSNLSSVLTGLRVPSARELGALVAELGGTPEEWIEMTTDAMRKRASVAASA